ncbi:MAG: sigma 54-interacting response regulator [Chitinophagaceae bacterium]
MSKKVLIVEDEFIVANDLRLLLMRAGHKVMGIAVSAEEAEELIQEQKPDMVIVDIILEGDLSGIDLARKLRADNIAFLYLSANSNREILEQAKTTEPYGFLVKPFREQDLLIALDIAWYRHTHSLEAKLRREDELQKRLTGIGKETGNIADKLLKMAQALQSFIPFDLITSGMRPSDGGEFNDIAFVRIGFDEYQFIGKSELETVTGQSKKQLAIIGRKNCASSLPAICDLETETRRKADYSLQGLMGYHFRQRTALMFPIALGYGLSIHFSLYSRQVQAYSKDHIALLERMKPALERLTEQTQYYAPSSASQPNLPSGQLNKNTLSANNAFDTIIGTDHLLLTALDLAAQVAPYTTSVLLLGESGTGKERVAGLIHALSPRAERPFIKVNCAAIPPTLIESELFGHEKGAFTGAVEKRKGKFELAHTGTIFLDEIGELPLAMQVKLLRVLQEREFEYVGGSVSIKVDVRIITATNRNLEKEIGEGNFRLDLYYRLNVFPITLPPLRERKSDIPALADHFAHKFCKLFSKPFHGITDSMKEELLAYSWPGNIRELENNIEQAVVLNDGLSPLNLAKILFTDFTQTPATVADHSMEGMRASQREKERTYIIAALKQAKGRIRGTNGAAELLKIKPTTLESKMARLHINRMDFM